MKDLTQQNIYKTFFLFGAPLVLAGLLAQAYGIIDTSIAGKMIGDKGLAATGATSPLTTAISSLFWGFGIGFPYGSHAFLGKENTKTSNLPSRSVL